MLFLKRLIILVLIVNCSTKAEAIVEESSVEGTAAQLTKLKAQCESVSNQLGCYQMGIDIILGLTTEVFPPLEEVPDVIHNIDQFNDTEEDGKIHFYGLVNGFDFEFRAHSIVELRYKCFGAINLFPNKINEIDIQFSLDGEYKGTFKQSNSSKNQWDICKWFLESAEEARAPKNHYRGVIATGNFSSYDYYYPYLIQYESLEQFERECNQQIKKYNFQRTNSFSLAIHTEDLTAPYKRYTAQNGGTWRDASALCSVITASVRSQIPADLH